MDYHQRLVHLYCYINCVVYSDADSGIDSFMECVSEMSTNMAESVTHTVRLTDLIMAAVQTTSGS